MNSQGNNDVSPEAMQSRIQQARREAETLKDRIKRKKDDLADTTRTCFPITQPPRTLLADEITIAIQQCFDSIVTRLVKLLCISGKSMLTRSLQFFSSRSRATGP